MPEINWLIDWLIETVIQLGVYIYRIDLCVRSGSVTLVLLPLKYELLTVVLLGDAGRCCTLMVGT